MPLQVIDSNISLLMERNKIKMKYYAGRMCSCVGENNGVPKLDCDCNLGFWYALPEDVYGIRTDAKVQYINSPNGVIFNGDARFTIPKYYEDSEQSVFKKISKGDILSVEGKYRRERDILKKGVRDKLYAFDVTDIINIAQKDKIFLPRQDFTLSGTEIVWGNGGEKPAENSFYTVEFTCNQQYLVWDNGAKDRGTDEDELPRLVVCVLRRYIRNDKENPIDNFDYSQEIYSR